MLNASLVPVQLQLRRGPLLRRLGVRRARWSCTSLVKLPTIRRAYRERGVLQAAARRPRAHAARAREPTASSPAPAAPTLSRRGLFARRRRGAAGAAAWSTAGQSIGGPLRRARAAGAARRGGAARRLPGQQDRRRGADHAADDRRRLPAELAGPRGRGELSRAELLALPAAHATTCRSPASRAGRRRRRGPACGSRPRRAAPACPAPREVHVESLQPARRAAPGDARARGQIADERSLLALKVNGADLSLDHGYPGADHRPRAARRALHEVGRDADLPEHERAAPPLRRLAAAPARARPRPAAPPSQAARLRPTPRRKVDVPGGIDQIELIKVPVLGVVIEGGRVRLDGDASFALEVHRVEDLGSAFPALRARQCWRRRSASVDLPWSIAR